MKIIITIFLVLLVYCGLSIGTIIKNGVALSDSPGIFSRLKIFLTTHLAETTDNAIFKELEIPVYQTSIEAAITTIQQTAKNLNWSIPSQQHSADAAKNKFHFIITTRVMRFKDDITIHVDSINPEQVAIRIRSESRVGTADFGANLSHVTKLIRELDSQLPRIKKND